MTKDSMAGIGRKNSSKCKGGFFRSLPLAKILLSLLLSMMALGCKTQTPPNTIGLAEQTNTRPEAIILREGDVLRISFPSASNFNTTQPIRRDGKISMQVVGEVDAAGLTPAELKKELIKRYASELTSKEIDVAVESSSFAIFVTGAVIKPGKISSNRPLTALEAIMEAGGFDFAKANLKAVKVIRHEGAQTKNFNLNLKDVMIGKRSEPFYLKPSDIIYVPERFVWY